MDDLRTVVRAVIAALETGPVVDSNLEPNGICWINVSMRQVPVHVSWYSSSDPCRGEGRLVVVDGEGLPVSFRHVRQIVGAAQWRAKLLQKEKLARLARGRSKPA